MKHALTGLDHPVIGVRDLAAAREVYANLGFIVPPHGSHPEWGTGNWCIQFARDYLELRGLVRPTEAPQNVELRRFLDWQEGLMGIAFGTTGAEATHDSFLHAGLHPRPVKPLTRDFELPEGKVPVSFRLCFLPADETPGLMHVVVCEHVTPERLRRPEWLLHPNGAQGVAGLLVLCDEPRALEKPWRKIFPRVDVTNEELVAWIGTQWIRTITSAEFRRRYPGAPPPPDNGRPALAVTVINVSHAAATRAHLAERGALLAGPADVVAANPARACGALLEFIE